MQKDWRELEIAKMEEDTRSNEVEQCDQRRRKAEEYEGPERGRDTKKLIEAEFAEVNA
jgi:hypothetical protein